MENVSLSWLLYSINTNHKWNFETKKLLTDFNSTQPTVTKKMVLLFIQKNETHKKPNANANHNHQNQKWKIVSIANKDSESDLDDLNCLKSLFGEFFGK